MCSHIPFFARGAGPPGVWAEPHVIGIQFPNVCGRVPGVVTGSLLLEQESEQLTGIGAESPPGTGIGAGSPPGRSRVSRVWSRVSRIWSRVSRNSEQGLQDLTSGAFAPKSIILSRLFSICSGLGCMLAESELENQSLAGLVVHLPRFIINSREDATVKAYFYGHGQWRDWAQWHHLTPTPADPLSFALFMLYKFQMGSSYSACRVVFYGVKYVHRLFNHADPTTHPLPVNMLEAAKRLDRHSVQRKEPLTPSMFRRLYYELMLRSRSLEDVRTMVFVTLGYCGFMRFQEIVGVRKGDVVFGRGFFKVFVEKSKTDVYREGRWLFVSSGQSVCPVEIVSCYLKMCGKALNRDDSFIFRGLTKSRLSCHLRLANKPLCYGTLRRHFLNAIRRIGEPTKSFGTHSLRSGGASAAANNGVPDRLFKRHGRWKTDRAKDMYVKDNVRQLLSVSRSLGL